MLIARGKKGFTLIELLIVIGILAILAAVTLVALNPAELLRRSRDSRRLSDLDSIRSALTLYLADAASPLLDGVNNELCVDGTGSDTLWISGTPITGTPVAGYTASSSTSGNVSGTGWIPVNLSVLPGGPSLSKYPIDPNQSTSGTNDTNPRYYSYVCRKSPLAFTLYANMESDLYKSGGNQDTESNTKDGGRLNSVYEVGSAVDFGPSATSTDWYNQ